MINILLLVSRICCLLLSLSVRTLVIMVNVKRSEFLNQLFLYFQLSLLINLADLGLKQTHYWSVIAQLQLCSAIVYLT